MTLPRGPAELPPALNALTDLRADLTGGCGSGAGGSGGAAVLAPHPMTGECKSAELRVRRAG